MRTLKYHEQKLLKKVDFLQWKGDDNIREVKIIRRYRIQNREDYHKYNRLCGSITKVRRELTRVWMKGACVRGGAGRPRAAPTCRPVRSLTVFHAHRRAHASAAHASTDRHQAPGARAE